VEMIAVCDLWTVHREKAAATNAGYYGRAPRTVQHVEELLSMKDVDAVMISTPEHSHSPILKMAAEAGKDAYCEKPMGNVLTEAKAARAVLVGRAYAYGLAAAGHARGCAASQNHHPGRHSTSQRTIPGSGAQGCAERGARRCEQD